MLDLISLWDTIVAQNPPVAPHPGAYPLTTGLVAQSFDMRTRQSSFEFQEPPNVIFVKSIKTLEAADFYDDLPAIMLTTAEDAVRLQMIAEVRATNPAFYDGQHMLITGVVYDDTTNVIYMAAKKVPYSFIMALSKKKFPATSYLYQYSLFKTGVLAPLIARDSVTVLLQRTQFGLYSVPGGFLEVAGDSKRLNFYDGVNNLVTTTAINELTQEIAGIKGTTTARFAFSNTAISAISLRQTAGSAIGTVEFVAPSYAACDSGYLQQVVLNNMATDAREHTLQHELLPLSAQDRDILLTKLLTGPTIVPGASLYLPVALSLTRLENQDRAMMALPRAIPRRVSTAWPLSIFTAKPSPPLALLANEPTEQEAKLTTIAKI